MTELDPIKAGQEAAAHMLASGQSLKGRKNVYQCGGVGARAGEGCGAYIVTIDEHVGVTPFAIKCGKCGSMATSNMYRVADWLTPTHEWARPEALDGIPESAWHHLSQGGLLIRPIGGSFDEIGDWKTEPPVRPAILAT